MLKIRLQRVGRKHEPVFRLVLTESQNGPKSGKFNEILGSYDARDKNTTHFDADKIKHWISNGAQISDTVKNLLIDQKIIEGKKVNVLPKKSPIVDEEAKKAAEEAAAAVANESNNEAPEATAPVAEADASKEEVAETPEVKEEVAPAETETPTEEAPKAEEAPAPEVKEKTA